MSQLCPPLSLWFNYRMNIFSPPLFVSGLPSGSTASDCGRHPLHPYLFGLHPRAAGPAPAGEAGESSLLLPGFKILNFAWFCARASLIDLHSSAAAPLGWNVLYMLCYIHKWHLLYFLLPTDLCNSAAVIPVHAVRLTQIPECGQAGHQCDGHAVNRSAASCSFTEQVSNSRPKSGPP